MNQCRLAVVALILTTGVACQSGGEPAGAAHWVPVQTVYRDSRCRSDEAGIRVLRDANALADWWQPLASRQFPARPLPQSLGTIDFDAAAVFVVSMGPRPTAGYDIEMLDGRASLQRASLIIPASWREPAPGAMVAQVTTNPCIVITVPAGPYESVIVRNSEGTSMAELHSE